MLTLFFQGLMNQPQIAGSEKRLHCVTLAILTVEKEQSSSKDMGKLTKILFVVSLSVVMERTSGMSSDMGSILVMNVPEKRAHSPYLIIRPKEGRSVDRLEGEKEERVRVRRRWRRRRRRVQPTRDKEASMKKLLAIAAEDDDGSDSGSVNDGMSRTKFVCPVSDGLFTDPDNCDHYIRCAHGKPKREQCPNELVWNRKLKLCDWPSVTRCEQSPPPPSPPPALPPPSPAPLISTPLVLHPNLILGPMEEKLSISSSKYIYLTFDDGPNSGTANVLAALNRLHVKATFFVNAFHLFSGNEHVDQRNRESVRAAALSGHALGDHSWDHMYHNSQKSPVNAYRDLNLDLAYFGRSNVQPVLEVLDDPQLRARVNESMRSLSRLPYSNHWRVTDAHQRLLRWEDCSFCTQPSSSQRVASQLADALHHNGVNVFGWDSEWTIDWRDIRLLDQPQDVLQRIDKMNKVVLLLHDLAFREAEAVTKLETFIQLALNRGFLFRTLHHYTL